MHAYYIGISGWDACYILIEMCVLCYDNYITVETISI